MSTEQSTADATPVDLARVHVTARDLTFGFPGRPVLSGVSFTATPGERVGVVGENGSGKTTLLRLLVGRLDPVSGSVDRAGTLALVEQDLEVADPAARDLTTRDLITEALAPLRAAARELDAATADVDALARRAASDGPTEVEGERAEVEAEAAGGEGAERDRAGGEHAGGDGAGGDGAGGDRVGGDGAGGDRFDAAAARLARALARAEHLGVWDADRRVDEALTRLDAPRDPDRRLATMSVGQRYRVRLACRLAARSDILLLDEPTNHLDAAGLDHLTEVLRSWRGAVVVVTHDRRLLDDVATSVLDLDPSVDGRPVLYGGVGYSGYRAARERAVRRWRQRWVAQERRRGRLAEQLDQAYEGLSDEWRPPKGSQAHRRATRARQHVKAADRQLEKLKVGAIDVPVPPAQLTFPDLPAAPAGHPEGALVRLTRPRVTGRLDLQGIVTVPPSGRLLVTGPNGSGKSTLLSALAGTVSLDAGERVVAAGARVVLLAQDDQAAPAGPTTGFDAYAAHALGLLDAGRLDPDELVAVAHLGLLTEEDLDRPLADLSVGQRRRFSLARSLLSAPHVLLLDEPTNHLSVALVDDLTAALRETSAAVVVATHDRTMRADLADWPELAL